MKVYILGDTHLGRVFMNGVPLTRRGERERMVFEDFRKQVLTPKVDLHVCLGDLFDKAVIPYDILLKAAEVYLQAAIENPDCDYVVLRGNHDIYRDLTRKSAFDVFEQLVSGYDNIHIVKDRAVRIDDYAFVGFSVAHKAADLLTDDLKGCHTLCGHYDVESFGGDDHNLVPTARAAELGIKTIFTGHVHKPHRFERDGVEVVVNGSMQPFAHGEEVSDKLYVTLTPAELAMKSPDYLRNRCVRVLGVPEGEVDCLQLTIKRDKTDDADAPTVSMGDFNILELFKQSFEEAAVPPPLQEIMLHEYQSRQVHD